MNSSYLLSALEKISPLVISIADGITCEKVGGGRPRVKRTIKDTRARAHSYCVQGWRNPGGKVARFIKNFALPIFALNY